MFISWLMFPYQEPRSSAEWRTTPRYQLLLAIWSILHCPLARDLTDRLFSLYNSYAFAEAMGHEPDEHRRKQ